MKTRAIMIFFVGAMTPMVLNMGVASAQAVQDGAKIYNRCAACHTATGNGVPGAYPPLKADFRKLASTVPGRRYLALAVIKGLSGAITVEGKPYRGFMPAQNLDDPSVAAVLNHIGTSIAKRGPAFKPFSPAEVAGVRAGGNGLTGAAVAKLHADVGGQ